MSTVILFSALVIFSCVFTNKLSLKTGMPALIFFMLLGMVFGEDGIFKIKFTNLELVSKICSVALFLIIFYGGFCTKKIKSKITGVQAGLLSSLGTVLTALFTFLFCFYVLKMPYIESFLLGAVVSSTDAASVFSILRSRGLNLKYETAPILEAESASNDPFAYTLTVFGLSLLTGGENFSFAPFFIKQIGFGAVFGILAAFFGVFVIKRTNLLQVGSEGLFVTALALFSYGISDLSGGNPYLSVYLTGFILGNYNFTNKNKLMHYFDGVVGLCQIALFFMLGLLSLPHKFFEFFSKSAAIVLFLTCVARPLAIFLIMSPFKCKLNQMLFVSLGGLRGATSIVFAIFVLAAAGKSMQDLFHVVFFVSLFSVLIQGSMLPYFARKLNMTQYEAESEKSLADYHLDASISVSEIFIKNTHPFAYKTVKEARETAGAAIFLIKRGGCKIIPKDDTVILPFDWILLGAAFQKEISDLNLSETKIHKEHLWLNKTAEEVNSFCGCVVMLIQRGENFFVPIGHVKISLDDVVIFYKN